MPIWSWWTTTSATGPGQQNHRDRALAGQRDGVAAVLREHANKLNRPTGFAIHTGEARLFSLTPAEPRAHLARTHNLEWVFVKGKPDVVGPQVVSLANAIKGLPEKWPADDRKKIEQEVRKVLGLSALDDDQSATWVHAAIRDIVQCRPPLSEVVERNQGSCSFGGFSIVLCPTRVPVRHTHHLAVRLRITHRSLIAALD